MTDQIEHGSDDRFEVAVIGAGQAGLAMGYFLAKEGRHFTILDAADSIGCCVAHSLGLARALHAASLRQPSWPAVSRRP